jgi:hypothetical protein
MDEDIDAAVLRCDVLDDCRALLFGGDVEREEVRQCLAILGGAVGAYDEGASGCECVDNCVTDAAARSGYQNHMVFEAHLILPFSAWLTRCSPAVTVWSARFIFIDPYLRCVF